MTGYRVLAIGAHPDDIELGCGGTLARHAAMGDEVTMLVLTDGQSGPGDVSRRIDEARDAARVLGCNITFGGLMDGEVSPGKETVQLIESVIRAAQPTIIYTHGELDSHQDHRSVSAATLSAGRGVSTLLHYQSPSARSFQPQMFVALDEESLHVKFEALNRHRTQVENSARVDFSVLDAAARYWGSQVRTKYAEAFEICRCVVTPTHNGLIFGDRRSRPEQTELSSDERRGEHLPQYMALFTGFHAEVAAMNEDAAGNPNMS